MLKYSPLRGEIQMTQNEITKIFLMIITTFLFVAIIIPFIKKIAIHVGALDIPNKRKVHSKPMPRLGGLGIFFGFLFGYMLFGEPSSTMNSILIGSFIIVLTGAIDDIKPLKASVKFVSQLMAAIVITCYGKLLNGFPVDFVPLHSDFSAYFCSFSHGDTVHCGTLGCTPVLWLVILLGFLQSILFIRLLSPEPPVLLAGSYHPQQKYCLSVLFPGILCLGRTEICAAAGWHDLGGLVPLSADEPERLHPQTAAAVPHCRTGGGSGTAVHF